MKNLGVLLDDKTIINFSFFAKLLRRYYVITTCTPLFVILIAVYIYKSQNDVYSASIGMMVKANYSSGGKSSGSIASLLGKEKEVLSAGEVLSFGKSIDFRQQVAIRIVNHVDFEKMNFNLIQTKKILSHGRIFGVCQNDDECIVSMVRGRLDQFYSIVTNRVIANKYDIIIKSLNAFTSKKILELVVAEIIKDREDALLSTLTEQIKVSKNLIEKKKMELQEVNLIVLEAEIRSKQKALGVVVSAIRSYQNIYMSQKLQLDKAKLTVKETEYTMALRESRGGQLRLEKHQELKIQISKMKNDLRALELASGSTSVEDRNIISQLKKELTEKEGIFASLGKISRKLSNVEKFHDTKDKMSDFTRFDYNILQGQIKVTSNELAKLNIEREDIESEILVFENRLKTLKPSFEYLKLLKGKLIQLELVKWTIASDLKFDKQSGQIRRFKRTNFTKLAIFSFMITIFIIFLVVIFRYVFDRRIYDEYELSRNFKDLEIIGNTPEFD